MTEKYVLIIDDPYDAMEGPFSRRFKEHGYRVAGSTEPGQAISLIRSGKPDVVLLDIFFQDKELGKATLEKIKKNYPTCPPVIMISETMRKLKYNAQKYQLADARLPKELFDKKEGFAEFVKNMNAIIDCSKRDVEFDFVVGNTQCMKEKVVEQIRLVADTEAIVLITGESGTGKKQVARAIRKLSKRNKEPFLSLNCRAIPDDLIESELFGYMKGAFTGAIINKLGRLSLAEGGTLFLDEIGDITPAFQVKLLRVLREKEYEPLGGTKTLKADVRFIAATNRDLLDMVNKKQYREDLYYRLNVFPIHLPPLRERMEDIPLLVKHFIKEKDKSFIPELREDVKELLLSYNWPGNIGELENVIEKALILAKKDKILQPLHFPSLVEDKKRKVSSESKSAAEIYELLANEPMSLPRLSKRYGEPKAIEVVSIFLKKNKRWPTNEEALKLFESGAGAVRTWLHERDITLEAIK